MPCGEHRGETRLIAAQTRSTAGARRSTNDSTRVTREQTRFTGGEMRFTPSQTQFTACLKHPRLGAIPFTFKHRQLRTVLIPVRRFHRAFHRCQREFFHIEGAKSGDRRDAGFVSACYEVSSDAYGSSRRSADVVSANVSTFTSPTAASNAVDARSMPVKTE